MQKILLFFLFVLSICSSSGQEMPGGVLMENSSVQIGQGNIHQLFSETIYFGPEADWIIDGTVEIWSQKIWIAPNAAIKGSGRLIIYNPGDSPYFPNSKKKATIVDGNNSNFIQVLVEHHNSTGIVLEDINDPGYSIQNPAGSDAARLNIGSELHLAKNGADVRLNGYNLGLARNAVINNYSGQRRLITDTDRGHVLKLLSPGATFTYPVASGDLHYAPVTISAVTTEGTVYVRASDRFSSPVRPKDPRFGINLDWNIYSPELLSAVITLEQPADVNNEKYIDEKAFIYQFNGTENLDKLLTKRISLGLHQIGPLALAANKEDNSAWLTKASTSTKDFFIPNTFSPNGDGINDQFVLIGIEAFDHVEVQIFNRWGNQLYHHTRYDNSWAGIGQLAGTYFYVITAHEGGSKTVFKGWVLLTK
ncbi:gliding motility-associated C-terminal domain-containing protein [Sphingobacterium psychroaquaticum]|uniref:Gliding motility-associated C-terminal domain-containing protein n=1 Tax=Sphingobacterium psychroaquaticum TaxID=561061 RepID=A0A1X7IAN9_9SPHI|nr:gliding motility-associated C-terminal domain-containing protein [Sphingobacterium psychroaquaticum]SMG11306.1 gliding motility-associated C-terminal domain-containing protein [Sphingobacterium psychroaquaticum]